MSIHMRQLSPDSYEAIRELCEARQWPQVESYMEPEIVAYLAVRLMFVPDNEATFPRGKWATIQRLQNIVEDYAKKEMSHDL